MELQNNVELLTAEGLLTEKVVKQIAKEVLELQDIRKAERKRVDYLANKVFEKCRELYQGKIRERFKDWKEVSWSKNLQYVGEASDIWENIKKSALIAAGVKDEKQAAYEGKGDIANAFAEELCETILKEK